jgi:arginyl-tRNA synthetase
METIRESWKKSIRDALEQLAGSALDVDVMAEAPPDPQFGDIGFPMFPFARHLRRAPAAIAQQVAEILAKESMPGTAEAAGPYLNVRLDRAATAAGILDDLETCGEAFGTGSTLAGTRIVVEFSCPNTNKPLHLGHLRNDALGMSVSRLLASQGAEVLRVNLINDRGIHICKSMAAYQKFGGGETPEQKGQKSDHFVGDYYVRYDQWAKADPEAEITARQMLRSWEAGEKATTELWRLMNTWATDGIEATYRRTGIRFDRVYHESETYLSGREQILKGLERGLFYRKEDGSIWVDLEEAGLDHKVLLRGDGTSLYVTQDIGTAIARQEDWPFDRMIYVVGAEQRYHFAVLFNVLQILGNEWASNLQHLAYGMVNLPEGKMKSREGIVVDADDLLDELRDLATAEIRDKSREGEIDDLAATAEAIALGAVNYYLLQFTPTRDIIFNPVESISFTGNTGPYLQYTGARISSLIRRAAASGADKRGRFRAELLTVAEEWELAKALAGYPEMVALATRDLNPSIVAGHLYEIGRLYNKYYHDNSVLNNDEEDLVATRLRISRATLAVLQSGLHLLGIPFLEKM